MKTSRSAFNHSSFESFMYRAGRLTAQIGNNMNAPKGMMMNAISEASPNLGSKLETIASRTIKTVAPLVQKVLPAFKQQGPKGVGA